MIQNPTGNGRDYHSLINYVRPRMRRPQVSPYPQAAQVVAQNSDNRTVQVLLRNGMILRAVVDTDGPNDALRVNAPAMPGLFTTGRVSFLHGDVRNGVWEGSYPANAPDAYNAAPGSPYDSYKAHWGGGWDLLAQQGDQAGVWADGSSFVAGFSGALPVTYRHTAVQTAQGSQRQRVTFTQAQRRPSPPAPYPFVFNHISGATVEVGAAGDITAAAAPGRSIDLSANGATITVNGSGAVSLMCASGQTLTAMATVATVAAATVNLGGTGGRAVARLGDSVSGGVIVSGSGIVFST